MYNFIKGGEQYKYAGRPVIVTIPDDSPHYVHHCTDYHYISKTKIEFSKKMFDLFGIHIDWHTYRMREKGQERWFRGEVMYWSKEDNLDSDAFRTLCIFRQFKDYLRKKAIVTLECDDTLTYKLLLNGDL